ncbi:MAG: GspE/PulE family protein [Candidatus Eremiobacteraeota bacterium]|nr:GspE/PulE family protein [Candidatus Eremiobacteraeota bacterium]
MNSLAQFTTKDEEELVAHELSLRIAVDAIAERTSDIHIDPGQKEGVIKYRIDGLLQEISRHPLPVISVLLGVIKKAAALKADEIRTPQEGIVTFTTDKIDKKTVAYTLRIATFPTCFGERMVLRILDPGKVSFLKGDMGTLGFSEKEEKAIKSILDKPFGLILYTGPTGCGKTTTAYASLGYLHERTKGRCSIISLENPIEYHLEGLVQTTVDSEFTHAKALKALMSQDPDVIFCGEIQNAETARLLMTLSLTGHLMLSQLHSSDVAGALKRLVDIGIEPYLLGMTIEGVIAQRLMRKICPHCREEVKSSAEIAGSIPGKGDSPAVLYRGKGCARCHHSGYLGRTAVYEILPRHEKLPELLTRNLSLAELREELRPLFLATLRESALWKAKEGITTVEEALRCSMV